MKTKSDLVVMSSGRQIFAFFCSPHDRRAQNSGCGYTALSFHTARVKRVISSASKPLPLFIQLRTYRCIALADAMANYRRSCLHHQGRFSPIQKRLINAFSKKIENHAHSVALFAICYNFVCYIRRCVLPPAMAEKVTERLWVIRDIVHVLET